MAVGLILLGLLFLILGALVWKLAFLWTIGITCIVVGVILAIVFALRGGGV